MRGRTEQREQLSRARGSARRTLRSGRVERAGAPLPAGRSGIACAHGRAWIGAPAPPARAGARSRGWGESTGFILSDQPAPVPQSAPATDTAPSSALRAPSPGGRRECGHGRQVLKAPLLSGEGLGRWYGFHPLGSASAEAGPAICATQWPVVPHPHPPSGHLLPVGEGMASMAARFSKPLSFRERGWGEGADFILLDQPAPRLVPQSAPASDTAPSSALRAPSPGGKRECGHGRHALKAPLLSGEGLG